MQTFQNEPGGFEVGREVVSFRSPEKCPALETVLEIPWKPRVCVLVLLFTFLNSSCAASTEDDEKKRYQAVTAYWKWGNYWEPNGVDFPGVPFQSGLSFAAIVMFSPFPSEVEPYWGFCSKVISVCQAYWALKDGSIARASGIVMRAGETSEQAFDRFREQGFEEAISLPLPGGLFLGSPSPDRNRVSVPPSGSASASLRVLRKTVTLGKLDMPEATRLRRRNRFVEDWVKSGPPSECRVTVPFADERSFVVPVLSECPQEKSIMLMRREGDEWVATPGGWIRIQAQVTEPIEDRIRAHASLVIERNR